MCISEFTVEDAKERRYFNKSVDAKYYAFKITFLSSAQQLKDTAYRVCSLIFSVVLFY